jgi:hypothetical protein
VQDRHDAGLDTTGATAVLAGPDERHPLAVLIPLDEAAAALVRETDEAELHLHGSAENTSVVSGESRSGHTRRNPFHVEQNTPGLGGRNRHLEALL